jgi:uncharacterized protein YerC
MAQMSKKKLKPEIEKILDDQLVSFLAASRTKAEARTMLEELFTSTERSMLGKRLATAALLADGYSFSEISELVGVTAQTINRVRKMLKGEKHKHLTMGAHASMLGKGKK